MKRIDPQRFEQLLLRHSALMGCNTVRLDSLSLEFTPFPLQTRSAVALTHLSFGASDRFREEFGSTVLRDDSTAAGPIDLSLSGVSPAESTEPLRAAFAVSLLDGAHVRVSLRRVSGSAPFCFIRAHCNGQERVAPKHISFDASGMAEAELKARFPRHQVNTIREEWTWECRAIESRNESLPPYELIGIVPVRIYLTAASPVNALPLESYYHLACAGPADGDTVEQTIWRRFTGFHRGEFLTNVAGKRLTFWRDFMPGRSTAAYIDRDAQALILHTDSSCLGWADLLAEVLAIHGIQSTVAGVKVDQANVTARFRVPQFQVPDGKGNLRPCNEVGMLVKPYRWQTPAELPASADETWTMDHGDFTHAIHHPAPQVAPAWYPKAVDSLGTPCPHESGTVPGFFANHAIVLIFNDAGLRIYDPAFGFGPHLTLANYEDELLGRSEPDAGGLFAVVGWQCDSSGSFPRISKTILGAMPVPKGPILAIHEVDRG